MTSIDKSKLHDSDYREIYESIICKIIRGSTKIPKKDLKKITIGLLDMDEQGADTRPPTEIATWFEIDPLKHENNDKYLMASLKIEYDKEVKSKKRVTKDLQDRDEINPKGILKDD